MGEKIVSLVDFLVASDLAGMTEEVVVSKRFGEFKFKVRALTSAEAEMINKRNTKIDKKGRADVNTFAIQKETIIAGTVFPNFKDAEMLKKAGCSDAESFINAKLLPGEISVLYQKISELSGYGDSIDEMADEIEKN